MSQHDMNIANQGFPAFRADLNDALGALVSNSSGATAPSTTFAHQLWVDTAANPSVLKIRNADNDAWITIGSINQTDDKFKLTPADGVSTDTISELTSAAGVTVDGVLLKDSGVGSAASPVSLNSLNYPTEGSVNFRNRIINGDMRIDQRNAGASVTFITSFTLDRWQGIEDTDGGMTAQQVTDAPAGFTNSLKVTTTTADASLGATQYADINQPIEGYNTADLAWGTAGAKTITISFWVKSSLTGTFGGCLTNSAYNRSYPFTYSISVADTWEYKTLTIAGDTSGTWQTTTSTGIRVIFGLGVGSTYSGTAGAWAGANYLSATGATSVVGTLNATWYITGVQLEVGSVATPFERIDYGRQLIQCQRYYWKTFAPSTAPAQNVSASNVIFVGGVNDDANTKRGSYPCPVQMRANPTVVTFNPFAANANWRVPASSTDVTPTVTPNTQSIEFSLASATNSCAHGHITASAEL